MRQKPDILERRELKTMPFSTPEGYFQSKIAELSKITESPRVATRRFKPIQYISAAATIAVVVASGFLYSSKTSSYDEDYENMLFYLSSNSNDISNYFSENIESELSEEDIIEYLIDSGASLENLTNE